MNRFPLAAIVAALALAAASVLITACGGSSNSQKVAKDVTSTAPGSASDSLYHEGSLKDAIKTFTDKFGTGAVQQFRIDPNSIRAVSSSGVEIVGKDGATSGAKSPVKIPTVGNAFSPNDIDASAPSKIISSLKSKGVTYDNVNYFLVSAASSLLTGSSGTPGWLIYSTKGTFQAKQDGSDAKPLGANITSSITTATNAAKTTLTQATNAAKTAASQATNAAKSLQDCIAKAGNDPAKLAKCTP